MTQKDWADDEAVMAVSPIDLPDNPALERNRARVATALREAEQRGRVAGLELAIRIFDDDQDGDPDFIRFKLQKAVKSMQSEGEGI